jgi:hypothetical protein
MGLTLKQEKFAIKYAECGSGLEAYKFAYNASKMKDTSISEEAYRLLRNPDVALVVQQCIDKAKELTLQKMVIDREYITNRILYNIKMAEDKKEPQTALRGLGMLSEMYDLNQDKINDRLISDNNKNALLENLRQRLIDVTPDAGN